MLKIRRPLGRLIFNMGIAIPGKTVFLIETAPWLCYKGDLLVTQWPMSVRSIWLSESLSTLQGTVTEAFKLVQIIVDSYRWGVPLPNPLLADVTLCNMSLVWSQVLNWRTIPISCWFNRNQSRYGLSQWKEALLCNASSHWLSLSLEWSLSN